MNPREWMRTNGYRPGECELAVKIDNDAGDYEFIDAEHMPKACLSDTVFDHWDNERHTLLMTGLYGYTKRNGRWMLTLVAKDAGAWYDRHSEG